jgi:hypothetical protein
MVDGEQEPLKRLPSARVEPPNRAKVEHAYPAIGEQQEVTRVRTARPEDGSPAAPMGPFHLYGGPFHLYVVARGLGEGDLLPGSP